MEENKKSSYSIVTGIFTIMNIKFYGKFNSKVKLIIKSENNNIITLNFDTQEIENAINLKTNVLNEIINYGFVGKKLNFKNGKIINFLPIEKEPIDKLKTQIKILLRSGRFLLITYSGFDYFISKDADNKNEFIPISENYKELNQEKQCDIHVTRTRSFNELEMLAEDLECVKMWLDDKKAPKTDSDGNEYSVVGRIKCLLNVS